MTIATVSKPTRGPTTTNRKLGAVRSGVSTVPETNVGTSRLIAWLKLYWLMILFCGALLGAGFAYLAWMLLASKYESYALLRVASSPFSVSNVRDPNRSRTDFTTYLKTNSQLIKNEFVLNKALSIELDGKRISDLPTIKEQKNPFQFLEDELVVSYQDGSEIIKLSMKGHNPEDVRRIVNAVQAAFMQEVVQTEIRERENFLSVLERTLASLHKDLNEKTGQLQDANVLPVQAKEAQSPNLLPQGVANPALAVVSGPPDWVKKQIAANQVARSLALREQVADLPLVIASQKARIALLRKQIEESTAATSGPTATTPSISPEILAAAVEKDPEVQALTAEEQRVRRDYAIDRSRYANPNAPGIIAKLERANQLAEQLVKLKQDKARLFQQVQSSQQQPNTVPPTVNPKIAEYDAAVLRLQELESQYENAKVRLVAAMEEVAKLPPEADPIKPVDYRKPDDRKGLNPDASLAESEDGIFRGLAQNAAALRLDLSSPKRVSVLQQASTPMQKDTRKQILGTVFAGLMGFALIGFVAVGYELCVKKTCSLMDVQSISTMPIVGVIPWRHAGSVQDPIRRSDIAESIDKLRTYVTQSCLSRGATTVTLTSPLGDEGKSFTTFHLAYSLADAGYKTIVVDFDLRQPSIHIHARCENMQGVCELLRGESNFQNSIHLLENGLHVLPAGRWSEDTRRLAGSGRLEQLLACLREPFDCMILHGHPLLSAAESIEVARRSDVVLLCTLCRETTLPLLKKATERVASLELPFSGIVYLGATSQEALC